jgi:hypothetical protein
VKGNKAFFTDGGACAPELFLLSNLLDYRFGAGGSSLLSCKQNLWDMFQSITWKIFMEVVAGLTVVYYVYVGVRFYWREVLEFFAGQGAEVKTSLRAVDGKVEDSGQPTLFKAEGPAAGESPELFKVMEKAITVLKGVISQGASSGTGTEELTDHIREVLGGYRQLRGTQYEVAINNFLVRICATNFSLVLDADMLRRLWR